MDEPDITKRPMAITMIAVLYTIVSVALLVFLVFEQGVVGIKMVGRMIGLVLYALQLVSALGLWRLRNWGRILAAIVAAVLCFAGFVSLDLTLLSVTVPDLPPPSLLLLARNITQTVLGATITIYLVLPSTRQFFTNTMSKAI